MARSGLHTLQLTSGERFAVLVDARGIPLQYPLLYSLRDRERGGAARLKARLLRIQELYRAYAGIGINLDEAILSGKVDIRDVESAVYWLEEDVEGDDSLESDAGEPVSASMRNQRISVWSDFMEWALESANWTLRARPERDRRERERALRLRLLLDDLRLSLPVHREVEPLSGRELEVLDDLLAPNASGEFSLSPFDGDAAQRTWVLYQVLRWSGMRLGEALKLRIEDVPPREGDAEKIIREVEGTALSVSIRRRVDDLADHRKIEPSVKRFGRSVPMPDAVLELLWEYIDSLPTTTPYLIRTAEGSRALSYSRASKICFEIRAHAARLFEERYPGDPHTLNALRWHRLRHTRAIELLPEYFPDRRSDPIGVQRFCEAFGWARLTSADPYLRLLHRQEGEALWRQSLERRG
jgi:integrase